MLYSLRGTVTHSGDDFIVIETMGIGFKVRTLPALRGAVHIGATQSVVCFMQPDAFDIYGFATVSELDMFTLLNSISGIGPRIALKIMGALPLASLRLYIASGDKDALARSCSVSVKTASKIILELREKVGSLDQGEGRRDDNDITEALDSLGYGRKDILDALEHIDGSLSGIEARTKAALKYLGARRKAGGR